MAGNDHIPTAPKDVIGDDGDLRQMRDALRAGKRVTLSYDGKVYVSADATTPMSEANENFIESKLGHVIELARQGYGVSVAPDGSISADRADHLSKVLYDPDPALSEQQRLLIQRGVSEGAMVRVHSDGRVEYFLAKDAVPPPADQVTRLQAAIDEEISSGRLLTSMQNGETLSANPDGSLDYRQTAAGPDPVQFPEEGGAAAGAPPLGTADELDAEAKSLELGAGAARIGATEDYETAATDAVKLRDAAIRNRKAAEAAVAEADRQVVEKQDVVSRIAAEQTQVAARAEQLRDSGDLAGAEEQAEKWYRLRAEERVAQQEVSAAQEAAKTSRADVERHTQDEATYEGQVRGSFSQRQRLEDVFDEQEDQARVYRQAATEMREAERLETAYADLQSRGVAGAERVRDAAAQHRAAADQLTAKARAYDAALTSTTPTSTTPTSTTPTSVTPTSGFDATEQAGLAAAAMAVDDSFGDDAQPEPAAAVSTGDVTDVVSDVVTDGLPDPGQPDPPDQTDQPDQTGPDGVATADPETEIEMPAMDMTDSSAPDPETDLGTDSVAAADIEIEMPAMDVGADSVAMADVTSDMSAPMDVPDDPFGGGAEL
jgi:hypothetical protein